MLQTWQFSYAECVQLWECHLSSWDLPFRSPSSIIFHLPLEDLFKHPWAHGVSHHHLPVASTPPGAKESFTSGNCSFTCHWGPGALAPKRCKKVVFIHIHTYIIYLMCLYIHHPSIGSKIHEQRRLSMADHGWSQEQHPDIEDLLQRMARCEQLEEAWDVNSLGFGFRSAFIEVWNDDSPFLGYGPWGAFSHGETAPFFLLERLYNLIFNHNKVFWRPCRHKISKTYIRV